MPILRRCCTPAERIFCVTNDHLGGQGNPCSVIRCRGKLEKERVLEALARLQQRHTKLRVRIEYDQKQWPWFVEMDPLPTIPCDFRDAEGESDAHQVLYHGWSGQFSPGTGPLLKLLVLYYPETDVTDVIGWFHHAIFDAGSVWLFFREFLQAYADPQALSEPAPEGFEAEIAGRRGFWGDVRWWATLLWHRCLMRYFFPSVNLRDIRAQHESYVRSVMTPEKSRQFTQVCREQDVSVTGILSAAATIVLSRHYAWNQGRIAVLLPRNARTEFNPPIQSNTLGCFATTYDVLLPLLPRSTDFWEVARLHSREAAEQFVWKDPVRGLRLIKVVPLKGLIKEGSNCNPLVINNQGRVTLTPTDGMPEVLDYYGHARNATIPSVTVTTVTFNDRMTLALDSQFIDQPTTVRLFHEIEQLLDDAIENASSPAATIPTETDSPVLV